MHYFRIDKKLVFDYSESTSMTALIQQNPKILGGQPIMKGTRIPVSRVLALIAMNYTAEEIRKELPDIKGFTNQDFVSILSHFGTQIAQ